MQIINGWARLGKMDDSGFSVYKHTSPNGKVYIGITGRNPEKRWKSGYAHNSHFHSAIKKYGWDNLKHEIVFCGLSEEEAKKSETELIARYKSADPKFGYNKTDGGEHNSATEEINLKRSQTMKKKHENVEFHNKAREVFLNRDKSYTESEEYKSKVSALSKKNWATPEIRAKIQEGIRKANETPETKAKRKAHIKNIWADQDRLDRMAEKARGLWSDREYYKKMSVAVRCIETGDVYDSQSEAARKTGADSGGICQACKRGYAAMGYHWEYVKAV